MKVGIYYGTTTFTTEDVANKLLDQIPDADVHNVIDGLDGMEDYDLIFILTPTYGRGELEDHWAEVMEELESKDLKGKKVALLGVGDSIVHGDSFVNTLKPMYDAVLKTGATIVGDNVDPSDYSFLESWAVKDGKFIGLPIDEMNEYDMTEERIENWLKDIIE